MPVALDRAEYESAAIKSKMRSREIQHERACNNAHFNDLKPIICANELWHMKAKHLGNGVVVQSLVYRAFTLIKLHGIGRLYGRLLTLAQASTTCTIPWMPNPSRSTSRK